MSNILARAQITIAVVQDGDKGDPGRDAVAYGLQPVREDAVVDRDRRLAVRLEYTVVKNEGGTQTVVDTARHPECVVEVGLFVYNLKTKTGQGAVVDVTKGELSSATYTLDNYGSPLVVQELFVQLLLNNEVVDRRYIPVVMKPHAVTEIDTVLGRISNTVYGSSTGGEYGIVNYITDITQRIDSIDLSVTSMKPGGGNLVINGDFGDTGSIPFGNMGGITRGIRTDQGAPGFAKVLAMDCTAANQGLYLSDNLQEVLYPMKPGLEYVLSFLVKASAPTGIHVGNGQSGIHFHDRKTVAVNTEWKRVEYTFRPRYATTWIKIYSAAPATLYVTGIQVEPGNKATEWDNTQEAVRRTGINIRNRRITLTSDNVEVRNNSGTTTLLVDSRGKLTASLIDVNSLFAQNIDARNGTIRNLIVDKCLLKGLIVRDPLVITDANKSQYITYDADFSVYNLDFNKCMSGLINITVSTELICYLPGIHHSVSDYTVMQKRKARSMVGNIMLVYNYGPAHVSFSGINVISPSAYPSVLSFTLAPNTFAALECCADVYGGKEVIYWKVTRGTFT